MKFTIKVTCSVGYTYITVDPVQPHLPLKHAYWIRDLSSVIPRHLGMYSMHLPNWAKLVDVFYIRLCG